MRTPGSPWLLADGVRATVPHRLVGGAVVHLWRPGPPPHLEAWYEPARAFAALAALAAPTAPAGGEPPVDVGSLLFVGRLHGAAGPRWLYRQGAGGEVLVDLGGRPWRAVPCPRARHGHRLEPMGVAAALAELRSAVAARGAHPAAGAPSPPPPGAAAEPGLAVVLPFRRK